MKLSLLILTSGKQEGKKLPINLAQFVIGRDPQCQLRPASPLISKRHCAIVQRDGKVFLHDFESTNGSFVNGQKVVGEIELRQDDRVKVGPIEFAIHLEGTPVDRPTPAPATRPAAAKPAKTEPSKPAAKKEAAEEEKGTVTQAALEETKTVQQPAKPKPKAPEKEKTSSADDDVAAMLLSLHDDDDSGSPGSDAVPEGTTEMEIRVPQDVLDKEAAKDAKEVKVSKEAKAKAAAGNTQNAAKDILEKMMRRPR